MSFIWSTRAHDLRVTEKILLEHELQAEQLSIFELHESGESAQAVKVELSAWVKAVIRYFRRIYGEKLGDQVIKRILSVCLVNGQTVH